MPPGVAALKVATVLPSLPEHAPGNALQHALDEPDFWQFGCFLAHDVDEDILLTSTTMCMHEHPGVRIPRYS